MRVIRGPDCAHLTALRRVWERWRRVARGVIVVARHGALYVSARRATPAQQARAAIEELGPTAIKLGQILSTRDDVLPPDWRHELTRLQDAAPLVPPAAIRAAIVEELGRPPHELFASFIDARSRAHRSGRRTPRRCPAASMSS